MDISPDQLVIPMPGDPAPATLVRENGRVVAGSELCQDSASFCTQFPNHAGLHTLDNGTTILKAWS